MAKIFIPSTLAALSGGSTNFELEGGSVREILRALEQKCPGIGQKIFNEGELVNNFVNIFVDDKDFRYIKGLNTPVSSGSKIVIMVAIAGG